MKHRIFRLTDKAINSGMFWYDAIKAGETITVQEYDTHEECVDAFEKGIEAGEYDDKYDWE